MSNTKQVIILDRVNSPMIAQAIFILKDNAHDEFCAVAEAERIVTNYLLYGQRKHRRGVAATAVLSALLITAVLLYISFL